ncbi:DUF6600 domain-containing protein [Legionella bozemanae]|uniref:DUF6600 domain-containing protein n=1 Tax=Legionella bozemanae TaxID=447 RepID=UPI0007318980|nr:DUF6600 domain-containing protein [Legionella bozemanae]
MQYNKKGYGAWIEDEQYGPVWYPNNGASDWAPYQDGQWIWLSFWGWTWVDNQPLGFCSISLWSLGFPSQKHNHSI